MLKYWKFNYQPGLTYPPNWYGEGIWPIPYEKVTVLLQNDKEGFGIAYCDEDDFGKFEGNIEILAEDDALALVPTDQTEQPIQLKQSQISKSDEDVVSSGDITSMPDETGIWYGDKLAHRWDAKPEQAQDLPDDFDADFQKVVDGPGAAAIQARRSNTTVHAMGFCGKCMKVRTFKGEIPRGLKVANIYLTGKCPVCDESIKAKVL